MAGVVKSAIVIGLILLLLFLSGIVGFLIIQPPRQITSTLTETVRETLTLRSVDTVTITTTRTITSTRTTTVTFEATLIKKEQAPPRIVNLSWEPVRIVNDKIYDIRVRFLAIGDVDPIVSAKLIFTPEDYRYFMTRYGMRPQDYEAVFPNDTRVIDLYPVDGVFDDIVEEFTTMIQNITGGVEYRIKVVVKDSAGREATTETKTPYIRQYENIGKQLYTNGIIISAAYMSWDMEGLARYKLPDKPLLGLYDALNDVVQWKHIDWATGHGINVFWCSSNLDSQYEYEVAKNLLSKGGIFVGAMPGPDPWRMVKGGAGLPDWAYNLSDPYNRNIFIEIMTKWFSLVSSPNYFRIDGKPAFFIWDENAFTNINEAYDEIKKECEKYGF